MGAGAGMSPRACAQQAQGVVAGPVASVTCRDFPILLAAMSGGAFAIHSPLLCSLLASLNLCPLLWGRDCHPFALSLFSSRFFEFVSFALGAQLESVRLFFALFSIL